MDRLHRVRRLRGLPHVDLAALLAADVGGRARAVVGDREGQDAAAEFDAAGFLHRLRVPHDHAAVGVAGHGRAAFLRPGRGHDGRGVADHHAVAGAALRVVAADVGPQDVLPLRAATCPVASRGPVMIALRPFGSTASGTAASSAGFASFATVLVSMVPMVSASLPSAHDLTK